MVVCTGNLSAGKVGKSLGFLRQQPNGLNEFQKGLKTDVSFESSDTCVWLRIPQKVRKSVRSQGGRFHKSGTKC